MRKMWRNNRKEMTKIGGKGRKNKRQVGDILKNEREEKCITC